MCDKRATCAAPSPMLVEHAVDSESIQFATQRIGMTGFWHAELAHLST